ncbi:hypothetical protein LTR84_006561 [Exophiala bonariae]|uniref:Uncharacterized protein n=1 Tax=Exophiala bonariae TaxID=1690606 RepID=A0AAV9N2L1_9EURO|nr:hypothetical protein LTR84_006561 [Exophiala bonariae]
MYSTRYLRRPMFPFVCNGDAANEFANNSPPRSTHPLFDLGTGFGIIDKILPAEEATELRTIFTDLSRYTLAVDDFVMGRPEALSRRNLANERNLTQHNLMSKCPDFDDPDHELSEAFYTSCWLAAAIYSLLSVFPMAQWNAPFAILSQRLKVQISSTTVQERWNEVPLLMLWITIMGAISSSDFLEHSWYISVLERLVYRLEISSWEDVKSELEKFLWYDNISSPDGYMIWKEIENSSPFSA